MASALSQNAHPSICASVCARHRRELKWKAGEPVSWTVSRAVFVWVSGFVTLCVGACYALILLAACPPPRDFGQSLGEIGVSTYWSRWTWA